MQGFSRTQEEMLIVTTRDVKEDGFTGDRSKFVCVVRAFLLPAFDRRRKRDHTPFQTDLL